METFKNGQTPPGMYGSRQKSFNIPHVVVLSNWEPKYEAFTANRWIIFELDSVDWEVGKLSNVESFEQHREGRLHIVWRPRLDERSVPRLKGKEKVIELSDTEEEEEIIMIPTRKTLGLKRKFLD